MHGPLLNTLQNDGVQGWPSSTLHGACENGVASIWRRGWASAALIPMVRPIRQMAICRNMGRSLERSYTQLDARIGRDQAGWRSHHVHIPARSRLQVPRLRAPLHAFFFTSLMWENTMPSARSLV